MKLPALEHLTGTYFNQDFHATHGGVWETVAAFMEDEPALATDLPDEIASALNNFPTEESMQRYLIGVGCEYWPQPEDNGYRGWLTEIARRVTEATQPTQRVD